MKAKDVLRKMNKQNKVYGMIGGSSPLEKSMIDAMKEYAKLKCKEQRKLCKEAYEDSLTGYDMLSAPEPEFD